MTAAAAVRVVVFDPYVDETWIATFAGVMRAPDLEFVVPRTPADADVAVRTADVVIATGRRPVDATMVATLDRAVAVLCLSVGTDQVDRAAADAAGIAVANVPDYCTLEVADHALALLLAAQRRLLPIAAAARRGEWNLYGTNEVDGLRRLAGQTLGVLGAGRIGHLVAQRGRAFGFTTIAHDPLIDGSEGPFELVSLDELARRSDAVVLCAALTPASRHVIGPDFFAAAKAGLILVNVARGGLVDEAALAAALDDGTVAVAALDVRETEPPDPVVDRLAARPDVIVTPHLGGTSIEAFNDLLVHAAATTRRMLEDAGRLDSVDGVSA